MEKWDLYDRDRRLTGRTLTRGEDVPAGSYHLVVHVLAFRGEDLLIQQRQPFKEGWPGMWDLTVGGSAVAGETSRDAARRELMEEVGIERDFSGEMPRLTIPFDAGFDDYYVMETDVAAEKLPLQQEEVARVRWAGEDEIACMIDRGEFIPYEKSLISLLFSLRRHTGAHQKQ